jgi:hypothetical protein
MTNRFLAGLHPGFGVFGIWLSKPGIDVLSTGPVSNFLLRPDAKNEQIVLSGTVGVGPGGSATVFLPANLVKHPYVMLHGNVTSDVEYPSSLAAAGGTGSDPAEIYFRPTIFSDRMIFSNPTSSSNMYGFFMVFNRSIGS